MARPRDDENRPKPEVIGRWEWRAFGEQLDAVQRRFAALSPERVQESDELYLLAPADDVTVKIRHDLMDIKRLEQVNENGLEKWLPIVKAAFPLGAADVGKVLGILGIRVESPARSSKRDEFVDELVGSKAVLRAVRVHKERARYTVSGCMAEVTEVRAEGQATRTIAIESEDPERLIAVVREFGLASLPNVSYPRGLKALFGFAVRRYAVIDVGTNSVKFHIGERSADGAWRTIVDRAEVTRLGEGLHETGEINAEPMERTVLAIAGMADEAERNRVVAIAAIGTAGMRLARNSAVFIAAAQARCGVVIEVIPGEEEGRLAYLAVKSGLGLAHGSLVVFDTGGGSSQFTFGHGERVDERFSVDVGAARYTEKYRLGGVVSQGLLNNAFDAIAADLARLNGRSSPDLLVAMGGAVTNLTAVKHGLTTYDPDIVQGAALDRAEIDRQIELYRSRSAEKRRTIIGLQPKRAEVILAGACIVRTVMARLGKESLTVSDRGLRHGLLVERFGTWRPRNRLA
jgi:exopolyphosphatase / guanosine-5'-triphosphate,3'-diphosphate pyrophosphatase